MTTCYFLLNRELVVVSSWKSREEIRDKVRLWVSDYNENGDAFGRPLQDYVVDSINETFVEGSGMVALVVGYTTEDELFDEDEVADYREFVKKWLQDHSAPEFEGMEPPCYFEWYNNEHQEYKESEEN